MQNIWEKGRANFTIQKKAKRYLACKTKYSVVILRLRLGHCGCRSGLSVWQSEFSHSETELHILIHCKKCSLQRRSCSAETAAGEIVFPLHTLLNWITGLKWRSWQCYSRTSGVRLHVGCAGNQQVEGWSPVPAPHKGIDSYQQVPLTLLKCGLVSHQIMLSGKNWCIFFFEKMIHFTDSRSRRSYTTDGQALV